MVTDDYLTYCGDHVVKNINIDSLCCTSETAITLYINCTLKSEAIDAWDFYGLCFAEIIFATLYPFFPFSLCLRKSFSCQ